MTSIRFFSLHDFQSCTDYVLAQLPDQFLSSSPMPLFIFAAPVRLTRPSLLAFLEQPPPVTVFRFSICSPPGEGSCAGLSPPKFFFFWLSLLRELWHQPDSAHCREWLQFTATSLSSVPRSQPPILQFELFVVVWMLAR
jgi:hypothetical protein